MLPILLRGKKEGHHDGDSRSSNGQTPEWYYVAEARRLDRCPKVSYVESQMPVRYRQFAHIKKGRERVASAQKSTLSIVPDGSRPPLPVNAAQPLSPQAQPVSQQTSAQSTTPSRPSEPASFWYRAAGQAIDVIVLIPVLLLASVIGKAIASAIIGAFNPDWVGLPLK